MTILAEVEDPPAEVDSGEEHHAPSSPPPKPKSGMTRSTEGSNSDHKDDGAGAETFDESVSKTKTKKKKKKKISRDPDGNSPAMLNVFNELGDDKSTVSGIENKTITSTTSTKKSKTKKKKKKPNTLDDVESVDIVSISSKQKSPKKKKKKSSKDGESPDVTPEQSARSIADPDSSTKSSSKKSKSKTKKKKIKSSNGSEHTFPDIERSKSLDPIPKKSGNGVPRRTKSMDPGQQANISIKRTMSLDTASSQFRPGPSMHSGRMNSNSGGRGRGPGGRGKGPPPVTGRGRGRGRGPPPGGWNSRSTRPLERSQNGDMSFAARSSSHERLPYGNRHPSQERYGNRSLSQDRSQHSRDRSHHSRDRSHHSRGRSHQSYGGIRNASYHDRSLYEGRSPSQERSQYGSPRNTNGRAMVPPQRGRRPMSPNKSTFDGISPASSHSHKNMYRAPSRPKSILRNSSHHGMLPGSSHHRSIETSSSHSSSQYGRRVNIDLTASSRHSTHSTLSRSRKYDGQSSFGSEIDSSDIESDGEDESSFALEDSNHRRNPKQVPNTISRGFTRTLSGLGNNSSHHGLSPFKFQGQSMRSLSTIERGEYQGENRFIRTLRYIHFLAPHPNEDPIKKKIRIITWCALFCDFLNALVAIITWQGETSKCCGQSIFSTLGTGEVEEGSDLADFSSNSGVWDKVVAITTYLYMLLIFLEVVPVMRDRFPFNLMNPFIGFLITFAVFFSDSIIEAASMWVFEAMAVTCEAINYRLRLKRFAKRKARLKSTKKEIEKLRKIKRKVKNQYENGGGRLLTRGDSAQFVLDLDDSSSFAEESSFNDDIETQHNSSDLNTVSGGRTAITAVSNIGTHRETRLLRERRQLIRSLADDEQDLRIHFIGVVSNGFLVFFSLLMIIVIAKNGGMCIKGMRMSNPFKADQLDKCNSCADGFGNYMPLDGADSCQICDYKDPSKNQCYFPYGFRYNT